MTKVVFMLFCTLPASINCSIMQRHGQQLRAPADWPQNYSDEEISNLTIGRTRKIHHRGFSVKLASPKCRIFMKLFSIK
jgi:hypothetical protein